MRTISIVFPVYNEEKRLDKTFASLSALRLPSGFELKEVFFVNDGSIDKTESGIKKYESGIKKKTILPHSKFLIQIISYPQNRGKGYAIKEGMLASTADYTFFVDADMSTPLAELSKFVPLMEKSIDVIIGTRKNDKAIIIKKQPFYRRFLGRGFTSLANFILNANVSDYTCGFKGFSLSAKETIFPRVRIKRWAYDAEVLHLTEKFCLSLHEIPVTWTNDSKSKVNVLFDVVSCLRDLFAIRFYAIVGRYTVVSSLKPLPALPLNA